MDKPVLTLDSTRPRAEPGGQAQLSVAVRNPGHLVESFRLDVVGLDPTWWQIHPPELPVYPGKEEKAVVVLSPPAAAHAPDEALPFGVRAVSTLDPARSVVEEGDLEVGRILDLAPTITPVTSRGRWSGTHTVTYTNWGNSPVHLRLTVQDRDEQLGFRLEPAQVSVPVGGSASAKLRVRPRQPQLRGAPTHRPFQVIGESSGSAPPPGTPRTAAARAGVPDPGRPVLDGAIQHLPVLSRAVVVLAVLGLLAVAGLVFAALRTSSVVGARIADAPPEAPTEFAADAVAADLIQLRWAPVDRAAGYRVQEVDPAGGAVLAVHDVPGGATAFDAAVEAPLTRVCYQVVAVRGDLTGPPSEQQCATSRDGRLPPPTDVTASPVDGGFAVGWNDDEGNSHVVLVDGSPVPQGMAPAGVTTVTVPVPAGRHCIAVIANKGETLSSPPSSEVCVESTGPPPGTPDPDPQGPGTSSGGPTPGQGTGTPEGELTGWVAVVGPPYQEEPLAESTRQRVQGAGATAQVVSVTELPQLGFLSGLVVVATGYADRGQAEQSCVTLRQQLSPLGCQPVDAAAG